MFCFSKIYEWDFFFLTAELSLLCNFLKLEQQTNQILSLKSGWNIFPPSQTAYQMKLDQSRNFFKISVRMKNLFVMKHWKGDIHLSSLIYVLAQINQRNINCSEKVRLQV